MENWNIYLTKVSNKIFFGKITKIANHPNADYEDILTVRAEGADYQCIAKKDAFYPFQQVILDRRNGRRTIRGRVSNGMLHTIPQFQIKEVEIWKRMMSLKEEEEEALSKALTANISKLAKRKLFLTNVPLKETISIPVNESYMLTEINNALKNLELQLLGKQDVGLMPGVSKFSNELIFEKELISTDTIKYNVVRYTERDLETQKYKIVNTLFNMQLLNNKGVITETLSTDFGAFKITLDLKTITISNCNPSLDYSNQIRKFLDQFHIVLF